MLAATCEVLEVALRLALKHDDERMLEAVLTVASREMSGECPSGYDRSGLTPIVH